MSETVSVTREIAAPAETVWAMVSDVTRMGEWSEECHTCEWHEEFDGPAVGAVFDGHEGSPARSRGVMVAAQAHDTVVFEGNGLPAWLIDDPRHETLCRRWLLLISTCCITNNLKARSRIGCAPTLRPRCSRC